MADFLHTDIYYNQYDAGATYTNVLLKASNEVQEFTESGTFTAPIPSPVPVSLATRK